MADSMELQVIEKVNQHIQIIIHGSDAFWEGKSIGRFTLDRNLTAILAREGIPTSQAGSILSPACRITVGMEARAMASIPLDAMYFAFAYPTTEIEAELEEGAKQLELHQSAVHFLLVGGYVYFDEKLQVCQINALSLSRSRTSITFTGPHPLPATVAEHMTVEGRLCKVTLDALESRGLVAVGWIHPGEILPGGDDDGSQWPTGAFMYRKREGGCIYYKMQPGINNEDFQKHSTFEQIARAAMVSAPELDETLGRLAVEADRRDDGHVKTHTVASHRASLINSCSLAEDGLTPIMWAAREGIPHAVKNLLDAGAEIGDATQLALENDNEGVASVLLAHRSCHWLPMLDSSSRLPSRSSSSLMNQKTLKRRLMQSVARECGESTAIAPRQVTHAVLSDGISEALLSCMRVVKEVRHLPISPHVCFAALG